MSVFADTSALVKLYFDEPSCDLVRAIEHEDDLVVAMIARVEVPAALWRKLRLRALSPRLARLLVMKFELDWFGDDDQPRRFDSVRQSSLVVEDAARLTGVHGLRGFDAIQLASALAVRRADPSITTFAVFDGALRDAAAAEGFATVP